MNNILDQKNKNFYYLLAAFFAAIVLYLLITASSLFNDGEARWANLEAWSDTASLSAIVHSEVRR